jgi:predicted Zn-dependent peptidase
MSMKTDFKKYELDNGVTVLCENMPSMFTAAVGCWLRNGSRNEAPAAQGGYHFIEHMAFKGTETRSARDIAIEVESVGAHMNAMTGKEITCYYAKALSENLPMMADVLTDMVFCSTFAPDEFSREQQVILEEIKNRDDTPEDFIFDQFLEDRLGRGGLGHSVLGYEETVGEFSRDALYALYREAYRPNNLIVAIAGNLNGNHPEALIRDALEKIPALPANGSAPEAAPHTAEFRRGAAVYTRDIEQAHFVLGVPGIPYHHDDRFVYALLDTLLSGGMASRLFQEVREKLGLVYDIQTTNECYSDAGFFSISASTRPANLRTVLEVTAAELEKLRNGDLRESELKRVKQQLRANMAMSFENVASRMMKIARSEIYFGRDVSDDEVMDKLQAVTLEDLQRASCDLFGAGRFAASILGPFTEQGERDLRVMLQDIFAIS